MSKKLPKEVSKAITFKSLVKEAKDMDKYSKHVFGDGTHIMYNKKFSEDKINDLLVELLTHIKYKFENNFDYFNNYLQIKTYVNFLIIKHFTKLGDEIKDSTLEDNISMLELLGTTGKFRPIFEEVFPDEEVYKVNDRLHELEDLFENVATLDEKLIHNMQQALKVEEVREKYNLDKKE